MTGRRWLFMLVVVLATLVLVLPLAAQEDVARVRIGYFAFDPHEYDTYIDGEPASFNDAWDYLPWHCGIAPGRVGCSFTPFFDMPAGDHEFAFAPAGEGIDAAVTEPQGITFAAGHRYSLAILGQLEDGSLSIVHIDETEYVAEEDVNQPFLLVVANDLAGPDEVAYTFVDEEVVIPYGEAAVFTETDTDAVIVWLFETTGDAPEAVLDQPGGAPAPGGSGFAILGGTYPGEFGQDYFLYIGNYNYSGPIDTVDAGSILPGDSHAGEITAIAQRVRYTLDLEADTALNIYVRSGLVSAARPGMGDAGVPLDPYLYVYDAQGRLLYWNDDLRDSSSGLEGVSLPAGSYFLEAGAFLDVQAGTFTIEVADVETGGPPRTGLRPVAPPYALHGPYWVGTMEAMMEEESDRPIPLTIWYPALNPDGLEYAHTYTVEPGPGYPPGFLVNGRALPNADVDVEHGPYPLIVFSSGRSTSRLSYTYVTEHLASWGFVVISPDHINDVGPDAPNWWKNLYHRPLDISHVIDFAAQLGEESAFAGTITTDAVGVIGHSFGAHTALVTAGAQMDYGAFLAYCEANRDTDWLGECPDVAQHIDELAGLFGLDAVPEGLWPAISDERVRAIVPLAPDSDWFGDQGASGVDVPTLMLVGSFDEYSPPERDTIPIYESLGSDRKGLVVFPGMWHMGFHNACDAMPWLVDFGYPMACADYVWDMDRVHDITNHMSTAFFLSELTGSEAAAGMVTPGFVANMPFIEYRSQGF